MREKYYRDSHSLEDEVRDYVNMFGFMQKNVNALDILIEDGKQLLRGWGASEPNFLLLNSRLTFAMQMNPERTQYFTQGPDGVQRLEQGPDVKSYRGIRIIHSRSFSIEEGSAPRDLLRRRVRTCEFYLVPNCASGADTGVGGDGADVNAQNNNIDNDASDDRLQGGPNRLQMGENDAGRLVANNNIQHMGINNNNNNNNNNNGLMLLHPHPADAQGELRIYDESSDSFVVIPYKKLLEQARRFITRANHVAATRQPDDPLANVVIPEEISAVLLLRPNIEHYMLGIIMGKGGSIDDLGATLWGQTELSCFDDGQHGVWGMSYKYHASAIVFNKKNLLRMWDISYDGYVGGKDANMLDWGSETDVQRFVKADNNLSLPYSGPSIVVLPISTKIHTLPSPFPIANLENVQLTANAHCLSTADLFIEDLQALHMRVAEKVGDEHMEGISHVVSVAYDMLHMHRNSASSKCASMATIENESTLIRLSYGGTFQYRLQNDSNWTEIFGCGHHGPDFIGKASERNGKGVRYNNTAPKSIHVV